jgi:hypothetical protein
MTLNFRGISLYENLHSLTIRHTQLIQLLEQPVLEMEVNLVVTFFFMALQLQKYLFEVIIFFVFLFVCVMGERFYVNKSIQCCNIRCWWYLKHVFQLACEVLIFDNEMIQPLQKSHPFEVYCLSKFTLRLQPLKMLIINTYDGDSTYKQHEIRRRDTSHMWGSSILLHGTIQNDNKPTYFLASILLP